MRALLRRALVFGFVCLTMYVGIRIFGVWGLLLSGATIAAIGTLVELREKRRGRL